MTTPPPLAIADPAAEPVSWPGERWSTPARLAAAAAAGLLYALLFVPLYQVGGRTGVAPFSTVVVAGAGALLGLRGGLLMAAAMLPLHTLLLNLAGDPGWDTVLRGGGGPGSAVLFVIGGTVGFLRDLAWRVEVQARQIAANRAALAAAAEARARAEAAAGASAARYHDLVENAHDLIYAHELDGTLTAVNAAFEAALGYSREELIGTRVQELVVPEHRERSRAVMVDRLAGGEAATYEVDVLASDGEPVPVEVSTRLVYRDGQPVGVEGIARDVRERRRTEAAQRASEARFRAMVAGAGVGVAVTNLLGQIQESNAALAVLLGRSGDELRGRLLVDVAHPDDAPAVAAILRAWREGVDGPHAAEVRIARPDGRAACAALTATLVRDERGGPWFGVVVAEDCTDRVRQRDRLATLLRVARRLAVSAERDEALAELLQDAHALLGVDAAAVFRWDEARQSLVRVHTSLPNAADLPPVPSGQGASGQAAARREVVVIDDYASHSNPIPALRAAGVRSAAAAPLLDEGRLLGVLWVASTRADHSFDRSDVEMLELLAEAAAATLIGLERSRLAGALLAARTAEHELNNTLAPAVGYTELLANDPRLSDDLRSFAELAHESAAEATAIVRRLRAVTRLAETHWGPGIGTTIDVAESADEAEE